MKRNFKRLFLGAAVLSTAALACEMLTSLVAPPVVIEVDSERTTTEQISSHLETVFGDSLIDSEILSVRVPTIACFLGICGAIESQFYKPCNKKMSDAFLDATASTGSPNTGFSSGSSGGLPGYGIVGIKPIYGTYQVCVNGTCYSYPTILGYDFIYGSIDDSEK